MPDAVPGKPGVHPSESAEDRLVPDNHSELSVATTPVNLDDEDDGAENTPSPYTLPISDPNKGVHQGPSPVVESVEEEAPDPITHSASRPVPVKHGDRKLPTGQGTMNDRRRRLRALELPAGNRGESRNPLAPDYTSLHSSWTADTFIDSNDAEDALCGDRSGFLKSVQIELIPRHIWSHLIHPEPAVHIKGFRNLFDYLNTEPIVDDLRQLVVNYFNEYPYLQPHLHPPLSRLLLHLILQ